MRKSRDPNKPWKVTPEMTAAVIAVAEAGGGEGIAAGAAYVPVSTFKAWLYRDCGLEADECFERHAQRDGHQLARDYRAAFAAEFVKRRGGLSDAQWRNHSTRAEDRLNAGGNIAELAAATGGVIDAERDDARTRLDDELGKLTDALGAALADGVGDSD